MLLGSWAIFGFLYSIALENTTDFRLSTRLASTVSFVIATLVTTDEIKCAQRIDRRVYVLDEFGLARICWLLLLLLLRRYQSPNPLPAVETLSLNFLDQKVDVRTPCHVSATHTHTCTFTHR